MNTARRWGVSLLLFSFLLQIFSGCGNVYPGLPVEGRKYTYVYQLTDPILSTKLEYKDPSISVTFSIDDAAISYTILNLTMKPITVESGGVMIGVDSVFTPARNSQSFYSDSVKGFAPMILPARGFLEDIVIPRNNVYWTERGWFEKDLFQTVDSGTVTGRRSVARNNGKKLDLVIPMIINDKRTVYQFGFKVASIRALPPDRPLAAKQRPPAPSLYSGYIDPWITVGIAAGIALVSTAIILSEKKPVGPLN